MMKSVCSAMTIMFFPRPFAGEHKELDTIGSFSGWKAQTVEIYCTASYNFSSVKD